MFTSKISFTIKLNSSMSKSDSMDLDWSSYQFGGKDKSKNGESPE